MAKQYEDNDTISDVFRHLVARSGKEIQSIAEELKLPKDTLYALHSRKSKRANIRTLKILADYFGEDLTIFCGLQDYSPPLKLSAEQKMILEDYDRLTDDAKLSVIGYIKRLCMDPENITRLI